MRLIALLSWFDERTDWLAELVASMGAAGIDHVVAFDGAYAIYPQAQGSSGSEQAAVVAATAVGARMGVTVHVPQWPWIGNEIEKRTALFALGHLVAEPGEDWLVIADADEVWEPGPLRTCLESTDFDVVEVILWEHVAAGEHEWNREPVRKCFRAHPGGIRVEGHHARYVDGDNRVLWDAARRMEQIDAETLMEVRVRHRPADREAYRIRKRDVYYERRKNLELEIVR